MDKGGLIIGKGHLLGVELERINSTVVIRYAYLIQVKKRIDIKQQGHVSSWEALKKLFGERIPIALCVNDKRVLNRKTAPFSERQQALINAFPDFQNNQFCSSVYLEAQGTGIGIIRTENVKEIIETTNQLGLRIIDFYCGPWSLAAAAHLDKDGNHWNPLNDEHLRESKISGFRLGEDRIEEGNALAFNTALHSLLKLELVSSDSHSLLQTNIIEEKARVRYEKGLLATVAILAVLLLGHLGFSELISYQEGDMNSDLAAHREQVSQVQRLTLEKHKKEELLSAFGVDHKRSITLDSWEVLNNVPDDIRLDLVDINPSSPIEPGKEITWKNGTIIVAGTCNNPSTVYAWISRLNESPLFTSAKLLSYSTGRKEIEFKVEIST